jgi:hypothetical protein
VESGTTRPLYDGGGSGLPVRVGGQAQWSVLSSDGSPPQAGADHCLPQAIPYFVPSSTSSNRFSTCSTSAVIWRMISGDLAPDPEPAMLSALSYPTLAATCVVLSLYLPHVQASKHFPGEKALPKSMSNHTGYPRTGLYCLSLSAAKGRYCCTMSLTHTTRTVWTCSASSSWKCPEQASIELNFC